MKVYQSKADHTFYEKQSDVPKGVKFKAVEFPFSASPKADFVDWLNSLDYGPSVSTRIAEQPVSMIAVNTDQDDGFITPDGLLDLQAGLRGGPVAPGAHNTQQIISFEDAFEAFPLAMKLHYAALAMEEARTAIKG